MNKKKAIIFDRDGTLIEDKIFLNDINDIRYLPNVFEALTLLKKKGFYFFVATNQSGIPRGLVEIENLKKIHQTIYSDFMKKNIEILKFYYAPYLPESNHFYRKPNPGMLQEAIKEYNIEPQKSWMIGDKISDVEAGHNANMRSILLFYEYNNDNKNDDFKIKPNYITSNLFDAAEFIISQDL